jgi:hypothetical protein
MKVMLILKRKAGMSPEAFQEYYERSHVKLAHKYLGHLFADYRRNYTMPVEDKQGDNPNPGVTDPGFDAITEIWLKDAAAWDEMQRIISDPEIGRIFMEDEEHFLDRPALRIFPCFEVKSETMDA